MYRVEYVLVYRHNSYDMGQNDTTILHSLCISLAILNVITGKGDGLPTFRATLRSLSRGFLSYWFLLLSSGFLSSSSSTTSTSTPEPNLTVRGSLNLILACCVIRLNLAKNIAPVNPAYNTLYWRNKLACMSRIWCKETNSLLSRTYPRKASKEVRKWINTHLASPSPSLSLLSAG